MLMFPPASSHPPLAFLSALANGKAEGISNGAPETCLSFLVCDMVHFLLGLHLSALGEIVEGPMAAILRPLGNQSSNWVNMTWQKGKKNLNFFFKGWTP